jgi:LysM repeat protein
MSKIIRRHYQWILGLMVIAAVVSGMWAFHTPAAAQDSGNLLTNGSFEPPYAGQGSPTRTVPNGWTLLVQAGAPDAFPHNDPTQILDGTVSWNLHQGYTAFTAVAYQRVGGLKAGDMVRATAYGWVYTCNDTATSCVIANPPYRQSDSSAGAQLRVGVDPNGGTDPNAGSVQWSATAAPYDQWAEMSVTAQSAGDAVTMFLYMTQSAGLAINNVYWDKASLVRTESAPNATATPNQVPFVKPQNMQPDGSIVHTVQAGDTLSSIAYAYRDYNVTNESIAALNPPMKPNTRVLQIGQKITILPPGSVDPATGQLLPAGSNPPPAATTPPPAAATPLPAAETPLPSAGESTAVASQPTPEVAAPGDNLTYTTVKAAFLPFEHGYMFWLADTNQILVLANGSTPDSGTMTQYQDTWREGMPETDPSLEPPADLTQPTRSFGQAWRTYPGVKDSLGWSMGETVNFTALVIHQEDRVILNGPDNRIYELTGNSTWAAIDYYANGQ